MAQKEGINGRPAPALRRMLVPLALAQFICSFAGSNMNVMITDISKDLGTTVKGIQYTITLFLLIMAALMIPGGKLTDKWGRKRCFRIGLTLYGTGTLLSALAPGVGTLVVGYSILEGVGTALLIPPVYILTTMLFGDLQSRAKAFGTISGLGGIGAAAGPLIGGLIATAISWRAAFGFQTVIVLSILYLSRRLEDPLRADPTRPFDTFGAAVTAIGLLLIVLGIQEAQYSLGAMVGLIAGGAVVLTWFFLHVRRFERAGREPLLSTALFRNRTSNLALVTQNIQWLMLLGGSFAVSAFLQVVRHKNAIQTGGIFTAATIGILAASLGQQRFAQRRSQRSLIQGGFAISVVGILLLLALVKGSPSVWAFTPGLLFMGLGVGLMLTPSVNVVQSSFPEQEQGEISGLSRSVSNLGSSLGTAIAGTIIILGLPSAEQSYGVAMIVLAVIGFAGLVVSLFLPANAGVTTTSPDGET